MCIRGFLGADIESQNQLKSEVGDKAANNILAELQHGLPSGVGVRLISNNAGVYYEAYGKYQAQEFSTLINRPVLCANTSVLLYKKQSPSKQDTDVFVIVLAEGVRSEWRLFVPEGPDFLVSNGNPTGTKYIVVGKGPMNTVKGGDYGDD